VSDLSYIEKTKLEKMFQMDGGYVLGFSNRSFGEFIAESVAKDISDPKYDYASGSKANRLRCFWKKEANHVVGKLVKDLLDQCRLTGDDPDRLRLFGECQRVAARLLADAPVEALDAIAPEGDERSFQVLARAVRESIDKNEPEAGLDRLHTYTTKLIRRLAEKRGVTINKNKPLHSILGEYTKALRSTGLIETGMTERILKSSISIMEAFNWVRNNTSLAHDNPTLSYEESLLIYSHVCSVIRFIRSVEADADQYDSTRAECDPLTEDLPF